MNVPARILPLALVLAAAGPAVAADEPGWTQPIPIDSRTPLELGNAVRLGQGPNQFLREIAFVALFDSPRVTELLLADVRPATQPVLRSVPIGPGTDHFALGPTAETSNGVVGGSLIDDFGCSFWRSIPPFASAELFSIDSTSTWVDSVSAAAGPNFFAACSNFDTGAIDVFVSESNAVFWQVLRRITPSNPLYINFFGGERISMLLDPSATDPDTTLNCILYEWTTGGTTSKRLNCANGATPLSDIEITTDVPNPLMQFDFWIENQFVSCPDKLGAGGFTRRVDQTMNLVHVQDPFTVNTTLGIRPLAPTGLFGLGATCDDFDISPRLGVTYSPAINESRFLRKRSDDPTVEDFFGPEMAVGPMSMAAQNHRYWVFAGGLTNVELHVSSSPLPIFASGVEDGTTGDWSNTVP